VTTTANPLVDRYLRDLRSALREMPRRQRDELVAEIEGHISESLPPEASDAEVLTLLDRLGDPEQIAAAERERLGIAEPSSGWLEWLAIPLLLVGGFVLPVVGWIVGVVFLWLSRCWTVKDKILATLLVPGGLLPAVLFPLYGGSVEVCTSGSGINSAGRPFTTQHCTGGYSTPETIALAALEVALVIAPIYTAIRLARRLPARRGGGGRRMVLPRRQSVALLVLGLALGGSGVWYYLSTRPPGHTARAEVLTGYATYMSYARGDISFVRQSGDDPLAVLHANRSAFNINGAESEDCRQTPCAYDSGGPCLRPGRHRQRVELGVVRAESPDGVGSYPAVWIRCLPG
jgi:uncharacterized membrane protein